ncbi:MAG: hypothetical protein AUJ92_19025 [Armatimonadetes bacterium CG2_30_59_28]|nr:carboxypeptidase regulatory-like domain-containing protein [Armatimonadota bacterium]OIO90352.1 MAG: hypothetical protein AUJ92_19025 [Armatimonadetes bacterium CG2_30_59_28]PIU62358.1 MAG: hypothetical protein COS85_18720 [Armatimonadetes bacterium CG07_land_8_20_14_0_80_59_28]PIX45028.1 MAG: hypothetical protein COZ56_02910 [Armatimonadetes bacterium CG_4_8_14_3_um_filter_58_9]PIY40813.1 MAG: hypothetical protein COZ05_16725 [Armatimonadetes bacterium CG_4_10_14_3_um_filter_59_10]
MLRSKPIMNITWALVVAGFVAGCGGGSQSMVPDSMSGQQTAATEAIAPTQPGEGEEPLLGMWPMVATSNENVADSRVIGSAPTLTSPANGTQVDKTKSVVFKWTSVSNATRYMISISQSSNFSTQYTLLSDSRGSATQKTVKVIPPNQPTGGYYWRVRASDNSRARPGNSSQWGPYSNTGNFTLTGGANACGTSTTGTVKGNVADASTNAVLSGATVELDTGEIATTDSGGNYSIPNASVGLHSGIVKKSGYLSSAMETTVTAATCVTVNVKLQTTGGTGPPPPPIFP